MKLGLKYKAGFSFYTQTVAPVTTTLTTLQTAAQFNVILPRQHTPWSAVGDAVPSFVTSWCNKTSVYAFDVVVAGQLSASAGSAVVAVDMIPSAATGGGFVAATNLPIVATSNAAAQSFTIVLRVLIPGNILPYPTTAAWNLNVYIASSVGTSTATLATGCQIGISDVVMVPYGTSYAAYPTWGGTGPIGASASGSGGVGYAGAGAITTTGATANMVSIVLANLASASLTTNIFPVGSSNSLIVANAYAPQPMPGIVNGNTLNGVTLQVGSASFSYEYTLGCPFSCVPWVTLDVWAMMVNEGNNTPGNVSFCRIENDSQGQFSNNDPLIIPPYHELATFTARTVGIPEGGSGSGVFGLPEYCLTGGFCAVVAGLFFVNLRYAFVTVEIPDPLVNVEAALMYNQIPWIARRSGINPT